MKRQIGSAYERASSLARSRLQRPIVAIVVDQPSFLSGKLLLAMPGMADPRFERAVIAMCVHDENGAIGIGVGHKRAGITFRGLLRQLDIEPGRGARLRGPSWRAGRAGRGFVLHSADWGGQDTLQVNGDNGEIFAMTGTIDVLRAIAEGRGPSHWIAALGYAGWGEGQLDEEMTRHGWFAARGDSEDPVRYADRRALGGGIQGGGHRPAPAGERDRRRLISTYKDIFIFAFAAAARLTASQTRARPDACINTIGESPRGDAG